MGSILNIKYNRLDEFFTYLCSIQIIKEITITFYQTVLPAVWSLIITCKLVVPQIEGESSPGTTENNRQRQY